MRLGRRSERGLFVFVVMMVLSIFTVAINGCGEDNPGIPDAVTGDGSTDSRANTTDGARQDVSTVFDSGPVPDVRVDAPVDAPGTSFNLSQAHSTTATRATVTFDAPPNAAQAIVLGNYDIPGLTLSGTPSLVGNTVTLTTSAQAAQAYTVTVTGVTRASDARALTQNTATFTGRAPFNVASAASTNNVTMTVTFDAAPNPTNAVLLANYSVVGLTLSGTPTLAGNTVTITTAAQTAQTYTVTVAGVTRGTDGEPLTTATATFTGSTTFNVASAQATGNTTVAVTFDAPPNAAQAATLANYDIPGLTLSGTPTLAGSVVTLTTSAQAAQSYTVTVTGVTRALDAQALGTAAATFNGRTTFNVTAAASTTATTVTVTFDSPPDAAQAIVLANYAVPGLTVSNAVLAGSVVTLTTDAQTAISYTLTVTGVTRAADAEALTTNTATFTGRAPFNVTGAASTSSTTMTVTFDGPPNAAQATDAANYAVGPGIVVTGTPVLAGNTVTINTSGQSAVAITVTVTNVTRDSDAEPLTINSATFTGTAVVAPTVTTVVVTATAPNNGTTPYNTGTVTVVISGTELSTVDCASVITGVKLDDQNGDSATVVGTTATTCVVDSNTQITATFPAGIRTNAAVGWNVIVTNTAGSNVTSTQKLAPVAGLLISEVCIGTASGADHEFVEIYNPTAAAIDTQALGLRLHVRNGAVTPSDTNKTLTAVTAAVIPSHGFLLFVSADSSDPNDDAGLLEPWVAKADYTFADGLVSNGGVYISLSATDQARVIDKAGWGGQAPGGFEGTPTADIVSASSIERKPAAAGGHATDTDDNLSDFNPPSLVLTPRATVDPAQP